LGIVTELPVTISLRILQNKRMLKVTKIRGKVCDSSLVKFLHRFSVLYLSLGQKAEDYTRANEVFRIHPRWLVIKTEECVSPCNVPVLCNVLCTVILIRTRPRVKIPWRFGKSLYRSSIS